jgi:hypothetical protein
MTDESLAGGSSGSGSAPSGLMASASPNLPSVPEYDSDEDYCWTGNEDGLDYDGVNTKSNKRVADYMSSSNHSQVVSIFSCASSPGGRSVSTTPTTCISLPNLPLTAICDICKSSV